MAFVAGLLCCAGIAQARDDGPTPDDYRAYLNVYNRPSVSPYLALVPQASSTGGYVSAAPGTYQNIVRPQVDLQDYRFRQSISAQNQPYVPNQAGPGFSARNLQTTGIAQSVRPTGAAATYMNYSHYYKSAAPRSIGH
jgi:hypothetical protein